VVLPSETEERVKRRALNACNDNLRKVVDVSRKIPQLAEYFASGDKENARLQGNNDGTVYVNKGISKEFLKLYQTLADEGIETWRKDPLAVVKNELEKGDLTYLSHGTSELNIKTINVDSAVVRLKNDQLQAEISLNRYWESADGVWLVKSYKILNNKEANPQAEPVSKNADFGIYLVKDKQLLVSQDGIVSFNPKTSTFKLTDEAVKRLDSYSAYGADHTPKINNRLFQQEFSISLRGATLFSGVFWSSLSSASYEGLVLLDSMMFTTTKELTIANGYQTVSDSKPIEQSDLIKYFKSIGKLAEKSETASTTTATN